MFATQASTLKVDSVRNEVYTLTVKKSVEKPTSSYETPLRLKTEQKKDERYSHRESINNRSTFEQSTSLQKGGQADPPKHQQADKLVEKFKREMG
jgi:hypothetical protein